MTASGFAGRLTSYAAAFSAPVETRTAVEAVRRVDAGLEVHSLLP